MGLGNRKSGIWSDHLRLLLISQYFKPEIGAPQVFYEAVLGELQRRGVDIEVVAAMPNHPTGRIFPEFRGRLYQRSLEDGILIHRVWVFASIGGGLKRILNYLSFMVTCIGPLFRVQKPTMVLVESPPLFSAIPAILFAKLRRVPVIVNIADLWPDSVVEMGIIKTAWILRASYWLESWVYRHADSVVAVTEGIRQTLNAEKGVASSKVTLLENGVDLDFFQSSDSATSLELLRAEDRPIFADHKVILYAGTIGLAQNLELMLEFFQANSEWVSKNGLALVLLGDGSDRQRLQELCRSKGIPRVFFLDPVPFAAMPGYFQQAWCGLVSLRKLPLFQGARPSKMFPIMASAKPVVYLGEGEGAKLISDSGAGLVVEPDNLEALTAAIQKLAATPELGILMGQNGRKLVEDRFSWSVTIGRWFDQTLSQLNISSKTTP